MSLDYHAETFIARMASIPGRQPVAWHAGGWFHRALLRCRTLPVAVGIAAVAMAQTSSTNNPNPSSTSAVAPGTYVTLAAIPPQWQVLLVKYGNRLQLPGSERITVTGTVAHNGGSPQPFQMIQQLPNSLSYVVQPGATASTLVFNGSQYGKSGGSVQQQDVDLVDTLLNDSPSHFFYSPVNQVPVRRLGSGFRIVNGTGNVPSGPAYDIYLMQDSVQGLSGVALEPKYFYYNSGTHLLEQVRYHQASNPSTQVQVILGNWTRVSGNQVAQTIQRLENGVVVLQLTVTSVVFGPAVADAAFIIP